MTAPHSPQKKKLTLRMKSLSLDSPESAETLAKDKRPNFGAVPPPQFPTSINYEPMEMVTYKYKGIRRKQNLQSEINNSY